EQHYIEKLARLKTIGYYYYPPKTPDSAKQREDFKLPLDAKLYVCPQSLFKFHPDFDHLLAGILNQDPNGVLVLIEGREESWSRLLLKRLSQKLSDDIKRVIVLPRMSAHDFLSLCMLADAILDTPGFSGGKTSLDCFALSLPIVTMASPYARGRLTIAQYKLMGIDDCIAENELNYIELAIKLANNKTWKKEISEKIKRKSHVLFKNIESVKELERFFIRAYARITGSSDETPIVLPDNHHRD
ncbi:MAG: hypothetical protein U9R69_06335, partial [Thermodesulfobacteriota bacterium]|nr:hypothetical protein [Thermodesulfobacteriota bacterium]